MSTSPTNETPMDGSTAADGVVPLLRTLGDVDAAVCVDGVCAVPVTAAERTDETRGADE
jgi:hypothetical protein